MYSRWMSLLLMAGVLSALSARVSPTPLSHHRHRRQIPCNHPLRPLLPAYFTHCVTTTCTYSDWTEWQTIQSRIPINKTVCASKYYTIQLQTREVLSDRSDCHDVNNTLKICFPTNEERLINGLGLGGSGQNYDASNSPLEISDLQVSVADIHTAIPAGPLGCAPPSDVLRGRRKTCHPEPPIPTKPPPSRPTRSETYGDGTRCPHTNSAGEVCQNLTTSRCGRSSGEYYNSRIPKRRHVKAPIPSNHVAIVTDSSAPISFDWNTHGSHFRQRRDARCSDDDVQQILFVLDSSGSIGRQNFEDMKNAIAKLVPFYCKRIETALITFSSDIRLEYCFNCFQNTVKGRNETSYAIRGAKYLSQCTHTGAIYCSMYL